MHDMHNYVLEISLVHVPYNGTAELLMARSHSATIGDVHCRRSRWQFVAEQPGTATMVASVDEALQRAW